MSFDDLSATASCLATASRTYGALDGRVGNDFVGEIACPMGSIYRSGEFPLLIILSIAAPLESYPMDMLLARTVASVVLIYD